LHQLRCLFYFLCSKGAAVSLEEMFEEKKERMERIWQIVNKLSYEEFRKMQEMLAPVEDEE
jgi:hypothetical protein